MPSHRSPRRRGPRAHVCRLLAATAAVTIALVLAAAPAWWGALGSSTEAARSLGAVGLLAGLIVLFLLLQGRLTRGDTRLIEAPAESEQREFR
jgi:hypothetical protein